jgi:hypothetical protein
MKNLSSASPRTLEAFLQVCPGVSVVTTVAFVVDHKYRKVGRNTKSAVFFVQKKYSIGVNLAEDLGKAQRGPAEEK